MHQKMLVADGGVQLYLGSANFDWLSLAQVKELGLIVSSGSAAAPSQLGTGLTSLFEKWWRWAGLTPSGSTMWQH